MIKTKIKKILVALDGSKNSQRGLDLGIDDIIQYYIGKEGILAIKRIKESNISKLAKSLSGKQQLAVEKFADSMESIPLALARNAGMNSIDSITQLRAKQNTGMKIILRGLICHLSSQYLNQKQFL
jgi:chaperonin GroEL (HSP60 family)